MENESPFKTLKILKEYSDNIALVLFLLLPISFFFGMFFMGPQINDSSIEDLNEINNNLKNLVEIKDKKFEENEELILHIQNIINPNLFSDHYFLEGYITSYDYYEIYKVPLDELDRLKINDESRKLIQEIEFYSLDSLKIALREFYTKENGDLDSNKFIAFSYSSEDVRRYKIKSMKDIVLPDSVLQNINSILDIQYESDEALRQGLRKAIGIANYNKYSSLILSCKGEISTWKKTTFKILITLFSFAILIRIISGFLLRNKKQELQDKEIKKNIEDAKSNINDQPNKILPVWDLANNTLQKYYQKNLSQVNSIFNLSVVVMFVGFILIVSIIIFSVFYKFDADIKSIGIIAGIITEFIGATFLFIYKSTIKQALEHSKSLEEMNNVGMSIKIIESIDVSTKNQEKIEDAKIEIAKKLLKTP